MPGLEEPGRPLRQAQAVGAETDRLHHLADGARPHQPQRLDGGGAFEAFGEEHGEQPPGLGLDRARLGQLIEIGEGGLVREDILAVPHGLDAEPGPLVGHGGGDQQVDRRVLEDSARIADPAGVGMGPAKRLGEIGLRGVKGDECAPGLAQAGDLPVDVEMIDADDAEADGGFCFI